jgi:SAM-dependent methyltransferase
MHLLRPGYRAYERLRSLGAPHVAVAGNDSLPLPPPRLMLRVAGTPNAGWFLESGRLAVATLAEGLGRRGLMLEELESVFDFGCGCGRVLRHLGGLRATLAGSDADGDAVSWCRLNLPFAQVVRNGPGPPLPFDEASFDLAYGLSVLTHLPASLQRAWAAELARIVRPRGHVLLTVHGGSYTDGLAADERRAFERGELVVRRPRASGTNLCTVFHPPGWIERELGNGLRVVDHVPEGARGNPHQDVYVLERT